MVLCTSKISRVGELSKNTRMVNLYQVYHAATESERIFKIQQLQLEESSYTYMPLFTTFRVPPDDSLSTSKISRVGELSKNT